MCPQTEDTPFWPRSPYACAKVYAYWLTVNFRESYNLHASNGILFNHESPRRGETFVTRKITRAATRIKMGLQDALYMGNLDAKRDWGYAKEYAEVMWLMLQQDNPDDYVCATNETHTVKEFVEETFGLLDLDWKEYVKFDPRYERPAEVDLLIGDPAKLKKQIGWEPKVKFKELVKIMTESDLKLAAKSSQSKKHRSKTIRMDTASKIYVSGHRGMVGSAICRNLQNSGHSNLITRTRSELDLTSAQDVDAFIKAEKPEVVVIAAARVGGIHANNTYPAEFMQENLAIAHNLIHSSYQHEVTRVLFLGSSCIYPREAPQPMQESCLLTGPLEQTNEAYAIAKIAGLKMCEYYRRQYGVMFHSAMPTNLYGPGDNYHPENSHVLPALIRRFYEAAKSGQKEVVLWGTGTPLREFLHSDDCAAGMVHLLKLESPPDLVNIGSGQEISIRGLAEIVADTVGYSGEIIQDTSKPDGTPGS